MSERYNKYIVLLLLISGVILSLNVISAQDIQAQSTEDLSVDNTNINEINIEKNVETSEDKTIKESQVDEETYAQELNYEKEDDYSDYYEDCSSSLVQKNENETAISFRHDSSADIIIYISHDPVVKHYKTQTTYFFHCMMSPTGWVVGVGGRDSPTQNKRVEELAMKMINNNYIDDQSINEIFNIKKSTNRGHFIIKAPNGTYAAIQYFYGRYTKERGVLKTGEFITCPNDPTYYRKGKYESYTGLSDVGDATRSLAARDRYGTLRSQITTFVYNRNNHQSNISVYLANDDGRYVGVNSRRYCHDISINGKIIRKSQIPVIMNKLHAATFTYNDKNVKTLTTTQNITTTSPKVTLTANVVDDYSSNVNEGNVIFKVNGETVKDNKGNVIKVPVRNGKASYLYSIPYVWKNNFTYKAKYIPTKNYLESSSMDSIITTNLVRTNTNIDTSLSNMIKITSHVNYIYSNANVTGGYFIYKLNGVTLKDKNNNIIKTIVRNGLATLNLDKKYSPDKYNLTLSYIRNNYRQNFQTTLTINALKTKILLNPITTNSLHAKITGQILDENNVKTSGITKVCVKINGLTLKYSNNEVILFKVENGNINFDINIPSNLKSRIYNITIQSQEQKIYLPTSATTTLNLIRM
jgi:hypothetical protein